MRSPVNMISMQSLRPETGPRSGGFTLIELIFTVLLLAVLMTLAAPSLSNLVRDQRIKTATFDVYSAFIYARSEAIRRNATVDIIPESASWTNGWRIEVTGGPELKRQDALRGISITDPDGAAVGTITYRGDGRLTAAAPEIVVKSPESDAITARCVRIDLSGRPNITVDTNNDPSDGCQ
jgi:type IV fimbrial biogenesis protein FimT